MKLLRGWFPVAGKELRANMGSPRLLIIAGLLALAVLAGTYALLPSSGGFSGPPAQIPYGFNYYGGLNSSKPGLAILVASPTGNHLQGVEVRLVNITGPILTGEGNYPVLETHLTDSSGWAQFGDLQNLYPDSRLGVILASRQGIIASVLTGSRNQPGSLVTDGGVLAIGTVQLSGASGGTIISLGFADQAGQPQSGADVYYWRLDLGAQLPSPLDAAAPPDGWNQHRVGATDASGYFIHSDPLGPGQYIIRASKGAFNYITVTTVYSSTSSLNSGPDSVLAFSGLFFIPLILPLMALILSYDAIAREKTEGSLDMLLSKPVTRTGVAFGKLAGAFGSMVFPVVAVLLAAVALIWATTLQAPTSGFIASFLVEAIFLLLAYTLLFLAISSLARSLGTALLISLLFFLLFSIFWGVATALIAGLFAPVGSVAWFQIATTMSLSSPTGVYQQLLSQSIQGLNAIGFIGSLGGSAEQQPLIALIVAGLLWLTAPLVLFLYALKYRIAEG